MRESSLFNNLTANSVVTASCLLGLLYFGRDVLEPLALATILSLVLAPLIRSLRRVGLPRLPATLVSVVLAGTCVVGVGTILAFQLVAVTRDLPEYRAAIRSKIERVREITERPFARLEAELSAVAPQSPLPPPPPVTVRRGTLTTGANQPLPVEIRAPRATTRDTLARLFALAWGPIGETGLVLVLLIFILLEHESLRDRVIRLAGQAEISRTVRALSDATRGVSRFFLSQFVVNLTFGALVGVLLWAFGVPHAVLWGALSGLLRFVPYVGIMVAGVFIAIFVAAIDPGWTMALSCLALLLLLELVVAHVVEPKVYGHSSGLSPLAVIVSALFWGAMWGPVGLLLSTPLTLCLVVAGRHVRALEPVTILLGDVPNVNVAQRFYQRVLAGETHSIISDARSYLDRHSFARYCDQILLPGISMAAAEQRTGQLESAQVDHVRNTIADVAATLTPVSSEPMRKRRRGRVSLLDANVGAHLRKMREARLGRWQGSLDVPSHSIVLCAGLGTERDDLLTELLVRSLRELDVDARSVVIGADQDTPGPDKADLVSTVFLIYPVESMLEQWQRVADELRAGLPNALLVTIRLPFGETAANQAVVQEHVDMVLRSFEESLAFVVPERTGQA
ncbi:AI-2E family transporter [Massilia sp. Leaf139]|uniref:AI-2E family transporter n=1 Tax=Massilia sp. Leaf139 TaxID=1736272 RepID=UPI0006F896D3|nr:AI-2E family transporter [Massilia sp. Leaf139]KQQ88667.1 transporter [Massilia sp. Leaf139]